MVHLSRIYTRSGDEGVTGLGDGSRVSKESARVEAYGTVDELNSVLGMLLATAEFADRSVIERISNDLFDVGADLCVPGHPNEDSTQALRVTAKQVDWLERAIDSFNEALEPLDSFVLPGGNPSAAWLHLARTVCRRAERRVVTLARQEAVNPEALKYLNRLSDLLFVLARSANDGGRSDVLWKPGAGRND